MRINGDTDLYPEREPLDGASRPAYYALIQAAPVRAPRPSPILKELWTRAREECDFLRLSYVTVT